MHGLQVLDLKQPNFTDRLLRRKPKENAALELNNFIASTPLLEIGREDINQILAAYDYTLIDAKPALVLLYQQILKHFSEDRNISGAEQSQLLHLRQIFGITDSEIAEIESKTLLPIYQNTLETMLSDGELSSEERDTLKKLAGDLKLGEALARRAYINTAHTFIQGALERAVSDRRLSPEEDEELKRLSASVGVRMDFDQSTRDALERFRFLHRVSAGELPSLDVPIHLQRGESCHAFVGANHYEMRTVTPPCGTAASVPG
jgi:hypothetical protein